MQKQDTHVFALFVVNNWTYQFHPLLNEMHSGLGEKVILNHNLGCIRLNLEYSFLFFSHLLFPVWPSAMLVYLLILKTIFYVAKIR